VCSVLRSRSPGHEKRVTPGRHLHTGARSTVAKISDDGDSRLRRVCREWPRGRAAEQGDELPPPHSITLGGQGQGLGALWLNRAVWDRSQKITSPALRQLNSHFIIDRSPAERVKGDSSVLSGCDAVGCLRSLRAHVALDGVSWVQSGSVEIAVGRQATACYRIGAVICSLPGRRSARELGSASCLVDAATTSL
jgi:hypothetical protein